ncbi:hypothetical protein EC3431_2355 [Escherichia coli 3431]|nr:hypothetical protein EC3431_2355 [Escherichia coli 3431]
MVSICIDNVIFFNITQHMYINVDCTDRTIDAIHYSIVAEST